MTVKTQTALVGVVLLIAFSLGLLLFHQALKKPESSRVEAVITPDFNLTATDIAKGMEGQVLPLPFGQVWPFDNTQNVTLKIITTKVVATDEIVVVGEVTATAQTAEVTPESPKVQSSLDPTKKAPAAAKASEPAKPSKYTLSGLVKIRYEKVEGKWYLVGVEGLAVKVAAT